MARELAPHCAALERRFRQALRREGFGAEQARAVLAVLPTARAPLRRLRERLEYHGRRLAKLNVAIDEADAILRRFDCMASEALDGRFAPAREQLLLATMHRIHLAYYEVREAEAQAFFGIDRAESEASDLADLLRRIVGVLTRTFQARAGQVVLTGAASRTRPLYIERGSAAEDLIPGKPMRAGSACYWVYPMASGGAIQLAFGGRYPWLPRELALLKAVAARCEEAIERSRRESTIRRLEAQARAAEEEERHRIGRELHDEAGQGLMTLRLMLEMIERDAPEGLRTRVAEARGIAESTVVELRRIIAALSPTVLERLGLASAVRQLAARFRKGNGAALRVRIGVDGVAIAPEVQQVVYRVAQECLQNAAKHSGAAHVNLSLCAADKGIRLQVSDDGAGFRADAVGGKPMSFGLCGMRERAALLGGTLVVHSAPSKGTRVTLALPVNYVKDSGTTH